MGNQYTRQKSTNIHISRDSSSVTQNCTSMNLTDPLPVLEGDRLAVHIYILDAMIIHAHYSLI